VYHPKDDKLYFKEIKAYLQKEIKVFQPPFHIRFTKASDQFGVNAYGEVCRHAQVSPLRVSLTENERLFSNLLRVSKPIQSFLIHSPTPWKSHKDIYAVHAGELPPFCIVDSRLYTLTDLRVLDCPLRKFCDTADIREMPAGRWATDESRRSGYAHFLNRLFGRHLARCGIAYDAFHHRYYFPRQNQVDTEFNLSWHNVRTKRDAPSRTVAKHYQYGQFTFWRHLALNYRFINLGSEWFLQLTPKYFFTEDGVKPSSVEIAGPYTTTLKAMEHNQAVLNHVLFWADFLSNGKDEIVIELDGKPVMAIEKLPASGVAPFAIPLDPATFEEKEPPPRLSLFESLSEQETYEDLF
jgi:hypothetical protein